jgi:hypothetical protein
MVSTCANPECAVPFLYYGLGRLFVFEPDGNAQVRVESFWLCGDCAARLTLIRDVLTSDIKVVDINENELFRARVTMSWANKLRSGYA